MSLSLSRKRHNSHQPEAVQKLEESLSQQVIGIADEERVA